ncbi:MAG: hypothetical protein FWE38_01040 [Firmicutes bacterium]|nr:hypothetical protein [Bacillota bacterium]
MTFDPIEFLGIAASLLVLVSFLMKTQWKIRVINCFGCLLFVVYGIFLNAWSIWFLNFALIIIHIIFLSKKQKPGAPEPSVLVPTIAEVAPPKLSRNQCPSRKAEEMRLWMERLQQRALNHKKHGGENGGTQE